MRYIELLERRGGSRQFKRELAKARKDVEAHDAGACLGSPRCIICRVEVEFATEARAAVERRSQDLKRTTGGRSRWTAARLNRYTVAIEVDTPPAETVRDWILATHRHWKAVAVGWPDGNAGAILTVPAHDMLEAAGAVFAAVEPTMPIVALSVTGDSPGDVGSHLKLVRD